MWFTGISSAVFTHAFELLNNIESYAKHEPHSMLSKNIDCQFSTLGAIFTLSGDKSNMSAATKKNELFSSSSPAYLREKLIPL